jgi:hypothetical protein
MNKLLEIKHWLLLAIMIFSATVIGLFDLNSYWQLFGSIWCYFIYSFWLFSIGNLIYKTNSNSPIKIFLFKMAFIYPLICLIVFISSTRLSESFIIWLIPFQLLLMFFVFYLIFFVSKNFVNFEKKHGMGSGNLFSTFCAFWFFPLGIFFVQPRINQIRQLSPVLHSSVDG